MRSKFQTWHASKVAEQLEEVSVANVKVGISATVIKPECASWLISTLQNLQQRPVNGFKGAGIWDPVMSVISKFVIIQTIKSCIYVHMYDTVYIQYVISTIYHVYIRILQSLIIFIYTSDCNHGAKAVLTAIACTPQSCTPSCRGLVPTTIFTCSPNICLSRSDVVQSTAVNREL